MVIRKTRIRNLESNLPTIQAGDTLVFALADLHQHAAKLECAGFAGPFESGRAVLPSVRGPVSRFNAEGKFIVHRDQPKEKAYREQSIQKMEWHGPHQVPKDVIWEIEYERYPRTFIKPPGVEFRQATNTGGDHLIVADRIVYGPEARGRCTHAINLFLELFRECHVLNEDLDAIIKVPVNRLNWEVLPRGVRPWQALKDQLAGAVARFNTTGSGVFRENLEYINSFGPEFAAVGRAGFDGYVIFGFPGRNLFVCESIYKYNATYVFEDQWQALSQKTKLEILDQDLQKDRIIHDPHWDARVKKMLA